MKYLSPSVLSADFGNLQRDVEQINQSTADFFHIDVMDGRFVPNISFGFPVLKHIKKSAQKPLDVHLMIVEPDKYVEAFAKEGAHYITVHYEACDHLHRVAQLIRSVGAKPGVSLNPHTPVSVLEEIIPYIDLVLIMSVNPGFGGQSFIPTSLAKISKLAAMRDKLNPDMLIEVDGGVTLDNATDLFKNGTDILVAGSSMFKNGDIIKNIDDFRKIADKFA